MAVNLFGNGCDIKIPVIIFDGLGQLKRVCIYQYIYAAQPLKPIASSSKKYTIQCSIL